MPAAILATEAAVGAAKELRLAFLVGVLVVSGFECVLLVGDLRAGAAVLEDAADLAAMTEGLGASIGWGGVLAV